MGRTRYLYTSSEPRGDPPTQAPLWPLQSVRAPHQHKRHRRFLRGLRRRWPEMQAWPSADLQWSALAEGWLCPPCVSHETEQGEGEEHI